MSGKQQLNLFGTPPATERAALPGPAEAPQALERIAGRLPGNLYLGTSSWSFPGWTGLVYDRAASQTQLARNGLQAYARHCLLRAVGVDRTFYAPVPASTFAEYAGVVPAGFRFLVKACSQCTTPYVRDAAGRPAGRNDLFLQPSFAQEQVVGPFVEGLGAHAGPLVFQFPPQGVQVTGDPSRFAAMLGEFLTALPRGPLYAVELRDRALLCTDYLAALDAAGARHCVNVHPRMPSANEQYAAATRSAGPLVVRWMLHAGMGYEQARESYAPFSRLVDEDLSSRTALAGICLEQSRLGHDVFLIANNKAEGSAPLTVFKLAEEIERRQVDGSPRAGAGR